MSYSLVIEGTEGARRVRQGTLPRRGEWLSLELESAWCWLPVLEVVHALSRQERLKEAEGGCDLVHERAEEIVLSSLAVAVRAEPKRADEAYKLLLPPPRWPCGGRGTNANREMVGQEDGKDRVSNHQELSP